MKQEILQFDEQGYNQSVKTLEQMGAKIKLLYEALDTITGGEVDLITPTELDARILKGTKFTNAEAVANLLGVTTQYKFYIENYNKVDIRLFEAPTWNIKQIVLDELKLKHTHYMTESASAHYREMEKITEIINKKPEGFIAAIQKTGVGYSINKQTLNNLTLMYERSIK